MLFTSNRYAYKSDTLKLEMGGKVIEQASEAKYLGFYLDQQLSFNSHVTKICNKTNVQTKLMWRIRSFPKIWLLIYTDPS